MVLGMDFAMFMEKYGYKILWVSLLIFVFVGLPLWLLIDMHKIGFFTYSEAGFFVGLLIVASIIGIFAGKFMGNVFNGLLLGGIMAGQGILIIMKRKNCSL